MLVEDGDGNLTTESGFAVGCGRHGAEEGDAFKAFVSVESMTTYGGDSGRNQVVGNRRAVLESSFGYFF